MIDLRQGDCLEVMKSIPDGSVDMVLCDLPYGTTPMKWDSVIDFDELWQQIDRVTKINAATVLFGSEPFSTRMRMSNIKFYRYDWVWIKSNVTGFQLANKMPLKKQENISVFYKKLPTYNPQGLIEYNKVNKRSKTGSGGYISSNINEYVQKFTNYPTQILEYAYDKDKLHPTQKPVALLEYLIKTYTDDGQTVLDMTFGSGSTGVACVNTDRRFIGIELDPDYFKIAEKRIHEATQSSGFLTPENRTDYENI